MLLRRKNGTFKKNHIWDASKDELRKPTPVLMKKYRCSKSVVSQARISKGIKKRNHLSNWDGLVYNMETPLLKQKMEHFEEKLKAAADAAGNPVVWQRGMSLDGLPKSIRERIETALQFGI